MSGVIVNRHDCPLGPGIPDDDDDDDDDDSSSNNKDK